MENDRLGLVMSLIRFIACCLLSLLDSTTLACTPIPRFDGQGIILSDQALLPGSLDWSNVGVKEIQNSVRVNSSFCPFIIQEYLLRVARFEGSPSPTDQQAPSRPDVAPADYRAVSAIIQHIVDLVSAVTVMSKVAPITTLLPLFCVPVLIQDNIDVANLPTTAGTRVFHNLVPTRDSDVVESLKLAGAFVVGKTMMSPFGADPLKTQSELAGGPTLNPYGTTYSILGPSGGGSTAVALNYVPLSIVTGENVLLSAAAANLVGFKLAWRNLTGHRMFSMTDYHDSIGILGRKVYDVAFGADAVSRQNGTTLPYYTSPFVLDKVFGLLGMRIGVLADFLYRPNFTIVDEFERDLPYSLNPEIFQLTQRALGTFARLGATITNLTINIDSPLVEAILQRMMFLDDRATNSCRAHYFQSYLAGDKHFAGTNVRFQTLADIVNSTLLLPPFQASFANDLKANISQATCEAHRRAYFAQRAQILAFLLNPLFQQVDLIAYPTNPGFPQLLNASITQEPLSGNILSVYSGLPAITIPIGFSSPKPDAPQGLPAGLTLLSPAEFSSKLIKAAYVFQESTGPIVVPLAVAAPGSMQPGAQSGQPTSIIGKRRLNGIFDGKPRLAMPAALFRQIFRR